MRRLLRPQSFDSLFVAVDLAFVYHLDSLCRDLFFDLCPADLCPADLCPADLCPADLCLADLCLADLCPADLYPADLCPADLYPADLFFVFAGVLGQYCIVSLRYLGIGSRE
ncbi:Cys-every-fifth RiPP peptide CefA [Lentisphaera profundi]|uniref:Cys-every-fifth RiPP peptide CefA n=1 Tax=Lentisphaera profundi TaxID=1658616 RepID=UPI003B676CD4